MQRKVGQLNLADGLVKGANNFLAEADALIDWSEIEQQLEGIYSAATGRPSYPLLSLFKAMLLQQWYGLSDPRTEEAISDSISFRRFVGLSLGDSVPDHSTVSRTHRLMDLEMHVEVFTWVEQALAKAGLIQGKTVGIDASTLEANAAMRRIVRLGAAAPPAHRGGARPQATAQGRRLLLHQPHQDSPDYH